MGLLHRINSPDRSAATATNQYKNDIWVTPKPWFHVRKQRPSEYSFSALFSICYIDRDLNITNSVGAKGLEPPTLNV